jgi:PAS domain S-box-containing protein
MEKHQMLGNAMNGITDQPDDQTCDISNRMYSMHPESSIEKNSMLHEEANINYAALYKQQRLLTNLALLLNGMGNMKMKINEVLKLTCEFTGVSRVYMFEDLPDQMHARNTYEWCNQGIPSHKHLFASLPYGKFPSLKEELTTTGIIQGTISGNIPDDLKALLKGSDVQSLILVPVSLNSKYYGFIGFDECHHPRNWEPDEIDLIKNIAALMAGAVEKIHFSQKSEDFELRLMLSLQIPQEGLWDWNYQTGYIYFSDIWCQMLGYEPEELEPNYQTWENLIHPEDLPEAVSKLNQHLQNESGYFEYAHRLRTRDGQWKWILDRGFVVQRDENGSPLRIIGIHTDITSQKAAEEELKKSLDVRNKLFSIIAHDLRGHISNFLPALDILTEHDDLDEDLKSEILHGLKKASFNTYNLLENLLNWARYQSNKIKINKSAFSINRLIASNSELFESRLGQKSIQLAMIAERNFEVFADKDSVNLIIRNLFSNALKFTPPGGSITVFIEEKQGNIEIRVKDTGVGIKPEILKTLLRNDSLHTSYGTDKEKGAGLGLKLCREFAELNGGKITIESIPGQGSEFTLTLNSSVAKPSEKKADTPKDSINKCLHGKRILVVEDEPFNQYLLKKILKDLNIDHKIADNGSVALELLGINSYNLILLDLEMPVMDGLTFLKEVRNRLKMNLPIIAMSASDDPETISNALSSGIDDYLTKPYDPEKIHSMIIRMLDSARQAPCQVNPENREFQGINRKWSDISKLRKTLGDDNQVIKAMVTKFLEITPAYYDEMIAAFGSEDLITLKNVSHKIKSSIELVAAKDIVNNVRLINQYAGDSNSHKKLEPLVRFFSKAFPLLCRELKDLTNTL